MSTNISSYNQKLLFVYDNRKILNKSIKNIVGLDNYGEIVYKRHNLKKRIKDIITNLDEDVDYFYLNTPSDLRRLNDLYINYSHIIHFYANCIITDIPKFKILIEKINYVHELMKIGKEKVYALIFNESMEYENFLKKPIPELDVFGKDLDIIEPSDCIESIDSYEKFLTFFSGGFEARHFNSLEGDKFIVTKKSTQKKKIKSEHDYYYLIPDYMKQWFVTPFNYQENEEFASYSMERINAPDVALQWVHEAISLNDFDNLLEKIFFFITTRATKEVSSSKLKSIKKDLYIDKLLKRVEMLKEKKEYPIINSYVKKTGKYEDIDDIIKEYLDLYKEITKDYKFDNKLVIGHGDLCFSNMLYYKEIKLLKFIDVKGALKESDLWTDPYYDIAKLSHSICGSYDFFNNDMYELVTNDNCNIVLKINQKNMDKYIEKFKNILQKNGFDYKLVRLYESSLFLSMLPLHIDNPKKVIGFIYNAINILEELKK